MKNKNRKFRVAGIVLLFVLVVAGAYTAVSAAAGSTDPLVTLSYLTEKFTPQMESKMQSMVDSKADELTSQLEQAGGGTGSDSSAVFSVITLSKGQKLVGDIGCEVMLRVGTATCSSSGSTGLIDTTDGVTLGDGKELVKNHLYMVTISTRSVVAGASTVKLLARGPYTIV